MPTPCPPCPQGPPGENGKDVTCKCCGALGCPNYKLKTVNLIGVGVDPATAVQALKAAAIVFCNNAQLCTCGNVGNVSVDPAGLMFVATGTVCCKTCESSTSADSSMTCENMTCGPSWTEVDGFAVDKCWYITVPGAVDEQTCFCWQWNSYDQPDRLVITDLDTGMLVFDSGCVGTQVMTPEQCYKKIGPQHYRFYITANCLHVSGDTIFSVRWRCDCGSSNQPSSTQASSTSTQVSSAPTSSTQASSEPTSSTQASSEPTSSAQASSVPPSSAPGSSATHSSVQGSSPGITSSPQQAPSSEQLSPAPSQTPSQEPSQTPSQAPSQTPSPEPSQQQPSTPAPSSTMPPTSSAQARSSVAPSAAVSSALGSSTPQSSTPGSSAQPSSAPGSSEPGSSVQQLSSAQISSTLPSTGSTTPSAIPSETPSTDLPSTGSTTTCCPATYPGGNIGWQLLHQHTIATEAQACIDCAIYGTPVIYYAWTFNGVTRYTCDPLDAYLMLQASIGNCYWQTTGQVDPFIGGTVLANVLKPDGTYCRQEAVPVPVVNPSWVYCEAPSESQAPSSTTPSLTCCPTQYPGGYAWWLPLGFDTAGEACTYCGECNVGEYTLNGMTKYRCLLGTGPTGPGSMISGPVISMAHPTPDGCYWYSGNIVPTLGGQAQIQVSDLGTGLFCRLETVDTPVPQLNIVNCFPCPSSAAPSSTAPSMSEAPSGCSQCSDRPFLNDHWYPVPGGWFMTEEEACASCSPITGIEKIVWTDVVHGTVTYYMCYAGFLNLRWWYQDDADGCLTFPQDINNLPKTGDLSWYLLTPAIGSPCTRLVVGWAPVPIPTTYMCSLSSTGSAGSTEPSSAQAGSQQQSSAQPSSTAPSSAQPSSTAPSSAQASSTTPSSAQPSSTAPSSAQPSSTAPSSAQPCCPTPPTALSTPPWTLIVPVVQEYEACAVCGVGNVNTIVLNGNFSFIPGFWGTPIPAAGQLLYFCTDIVTLMWDYAYQFPGTTCVALSPYFIANGGSGLVTVHDPANPACSSDVMVPAPSLTSVPCPTCTYPPNDDQYWFFTGPVFTTEQQACASAPPGTVITTFTFDGQIYYTPDPSAMDWYYTNPGYSGTCEAYTITPGKPTLSDPYMSFYPAQVKYGAVGAPAGCFCKVDMIPNTVFSDYYCSSTQSSAQPSSTTPSSAQPSSTAPSSAQPSSAQTSSAQTSSAQTSSASAQSSAQAGSSAQAESSANECCNHPILDADWVLGYHSQYGTAAAVCAYCPSGSPVYEFHWPPGNPTPLYTCGEDTLYLAYSFYQVSPICQITGNPDGGLPGTTYPLMYTGWGCNTYQYPVVPSIPKTPYNCNSSAADSTTSDTASSQDTSGFLPESSTSGTQASSAAASSAQQLSTAPSSAQAGSTAPSSAQANSTQSSTTSSATLSDCAEMLCVPFMQTIARSKTDTALNKDYCMVIPLTVGDNGKVCFCFGYEFGIEVADRILITSVEYGYTVADTGCHTGMTADPVTCLELSLPVVLPPGSVVHYRVEITGNCSSNPSTNGSYVFNWACQCPSNTSSTAASSAQPSSAQASSAQASSAQASSAQASSAQASSAQASSVQCCPLPANSSSYWVMKGVKPTAAEACCTWGGSSTIYKAVWGSSSTFCRDPADILFSFYALNYAPPLLCNATAAYVASSSNNEFVHMNSPLTVYCGTSGKPACSTTMVLTAPSAAITAINCADYPSYIISTTAPGQLGGRYVSDPSRIGYYQLNDYYIGPVWVNGAHPVLGAVHWYLNGSNVLALVDKTPAGYGVNRSWYLNPLGNEDWDLSIITGPSAYDPGTSTPQEGTYGIYYTFLASITVTKC